MNIIVIALATIIVVVAYKFGRLTKGWEIKYGNDKRKIS